MDTNSNAGCLGVPMTPSRNSNRHELLWENFPNCTDAHWEEIGRTPNVGPKPRNYSKAVNLSDRRRTLSEGNDWFDDLSRTEFEEVVVKDKFMPFRDASSQVSGGRFKEARNSRDGGREEEVTPRGKSCNRERQISVGPRVLDSADFSSSSDDVLHGPVFYIGSGKTSLISNSPDGLLPKNNRQQLTKDISRAAKQLKYFEQPSGRERGQRTGSLSAATNIKTREYQSGYSVDWPVYEGLGTQNKVSEVDGGSKPRNGIFRISNENECNCTSGWQDEHCDVDIDECALNPCQSESTCENLQNSFLGLCPVGKCGQSCALDDPFHEWSCNNGGQCVAQCDQQLPYYLNKTHAFCEWQEGWGGAICDQALSALFVAALFILIAVFVTTVVIICASVGLFILIKEEEGNARYLLPQQTRVVQPPRGDGRVSFRRLRG